MQTKRRVIEECLCLRCDYSWFPRKLGRPFLCPNCNTAQWDVPKVPDPEPERKAASGEK